MLAASKKSVCDDECKTALGSATLATGSEKPEHHQRNT